MFSNNNITALKLFIYFYICWRDLTLRNSNSIIFNEIKLSAQPNKGRYSRKFWKAEDRASLNQVHQPNWTRSGNGWDPSRIPTYNSSCFARLLSTGIQIHSWKRIRTSSKKWLQVHRKYLQTSSKPFQRVQALDHYPTILHEWIRWMQDNNVCWNHFYHEREAPRAHLSPK